MADSRQSLKYDVWRKPSKPVDISGKTPPNAPGKLGICTSMVESTDVLLSRSLLEQCRLEESPTSLSPNSTEASWKSRWWSDAANSNKTSLSTRTRGSSIGQAGITEEDDLEDHENPGHESASFSKQQTATQRCWSHVSALSTMLGRVQGPEAVCPPKHDIWALMATARKFQPCLGKLARCSGQGSRKAQSCPNPRTQRILNEEALSPSSASKPVAIPAPKSPLGRPARGDESTETSCTNSDQTTAMRTSCSSSSSPGLLSREEQKRLLLDRLMEYFFAVLARGQTNGGGGGGGGGAGCSARPGAKGRDGGSSCTATVLQSGPSRKGKRPANTDEHGGSDDEEHEAPKPKKAKSEEAEVRRLACPFFKRNPHRYKDQGKCVGPGWMTVHRLKEHLYRRHRLPIHCYRCHEVFTSDKLLQLHSRSEARCAVRDEAQELEGIDALQERHLRSRKRTDKTEEDKWRDVFRICFPTDVPGCMPTPWFELPAWGLEGSPSSAGAGAGGPASSDIAHYEEFLRRELPRRVRGELEVRIEQALSPVEESLKRQLVDIVRDMQQRLFADFRRLQGGEGPLPRDEAAAGDVGLGCSELADGVDVKGKGKAVASESPEQLTIETSGASFGDLVGETPPISTGWATSQPIDVFRQPQPFFDNATRFDGVMFDFNQGGGDWSWPDSGYMSAAMSAVSSKVIMDEDGMMCDDGTISGHFAQASTYGGY